MAAGDPEQIWTRIEAALARLDGAVAPAALPDDRDVAADLPARHAALCAAVRAALAQFDALIAETAQPTDPAAAPGSAA